MGVCEEERERERETIFFSRTDPEFTRSSARASHGARCGVGALRGAGGIWLGNFSSRSLCTECLC